jgi:mycothiol synthase
MDVVALNELDAPRRDAVTALLQRADAAADHPPLPEPQFHALADSGPPHDGRLVLAERAARGTGDADRSLAGFALLTPGRDGSTSIHVVTDPELAAERPSEDPSELASRLVGAAVALADKDGSTPLHLWAMQAGPADDERAKRHGFVPERDVIQMRVPLPLADDVLRATHPLVTRPFVPGQDDEAWLKVNNRAFAGHPEQGSWTLPQLHERLAADWVDLAGFLVADDPDGEGLIGFCWTKIHRNRVPVLGEIYVIGVDPAHHGGGLGRALTVAGLNAMADRGVRTGMLYTDDSNEAAVALYGRLGFTVDHVDRSYRRVRRPVS